MLADLMLRNFGYRGDTETYDDIANANLIRVIERRRGMPVALGILWLHAARAAGLPCGGVNFPSHFLVRIGLGRRRLVIDVFGGGNVLDAGALQGLLRAVQGRKIKLETAMLAEMSARDILLRLHGNIHSRQEQYGAYADALATIGDMQLIAPRNAHLWLNEARLRRLTDDPAGVFAALNHYLTLESEGPTAERVRLTLIELRNRMN